MVKLLLVALLLTQDGGAGPKQALLGSWDGLQDGSEFLTLDADGTAKMLGRPFTWTVSGDSIFMTDAHGDVDRLRYHLSGDQLDLSFGADTLTLLRKGSPTEAAAHAPARNHSKRRSAATPSRAH